uniref:Uncharacterized protein n=1 Tax=Pelodiscus sinensis TaxID=13735 RepID=K7F9J5_PELSI
SVCTDKDPVYLDCGHNFCQACISQWWQGLSRNFRCPECRETFSQRNFKPNRQLRNIVEASRPLRMEPQKVCEKHKEGFQIFCQEDQIPICVVCHSSQEHKDHTVVPIEEAAKAYQMFLFVVRFGEESFNWASQRLESVVFHWGYKQLETEKQKIVSEFEQLSNFLKEQERLLLARGALFCLPHCARPKSPLGHQRCLAQVGGSFSLPLSLPRAGYLRIVAPRTERGEAWRGKMPESLPNWGRFCPGQDRTLPRGPLDVTLDPDTAHPQLVVSEDRRRVRWECKWQSLPDTPERFDPERCVLGREAFTSGRHYWEVEVNVERQGRWGLGVAREPVSRKGKVRFSPEQGVWAVEGEWDRCWACTAPGQGTTLPQGRMPRRIRVYLDCEGGRVAFYDAGSVESIFTFPPAPFAGERIRPIFRCLGYKDSDSYLPCQLSLCP